MTRILICLRCDHSMATETHHGLPPSCPVCKEPGFWRVAMVDEFTKSDRTMIADHHYKVQTQD